MIQQHDWKHEGHVQVVFRTSGNQSSPRFLVIKRCKNPAVRDQSARCTLQSFSMKLTPPPSLLTSTESSFRAERGNICTPCLWEEWRPEHDVLKSLPWLPTCFGIDLKVLLLVFRCLNGFRSSFLSDLLLPRQPSQMLRSSGAGLWFSPQLEAELRLMLHSALPTHLYGTSGPFVCAKYNFIC